MHILITGCTDTHVNAPNRVLDVKFESTPALLARLLRRDEQKVHHGLPSDALDDYDKVICFLYPKTKHARHVENAENVLRRRPDAIIGVDDWSAPMISGQWPESGGRNFIAPMFSWGDSSALADTMDLSVKSNLFGIDLSCLINLPELGLGPRPRCWVNASYHHNNHRWAARTASWPIASYGCKALCQPRILESDAAALYAKAAGVLVPPYDVSGTGWWRPRILQATAAGAVLGADNRELYAILNEDIATTNVCHLEQMGDDEIADVAKHQRSVLLESITPEEDVIATVNDLLRL